MGENDLDYTFPNGDYYEGEWKNGKPHGQGTFIYNTKYNNQKKYVGGFKDGKHHGHGSYTYSYGIKYVGEFKDGKWHGHGSYNYANGNTYVGQWENGNPQGQGTVIYTNGNKYVGEFKDGMKSGYGVHIFAEGERYEGEFKDDKFSGQGTYTLILSEDAKKKYVGQWKDNKAHGQGTSYDAKGKVYQEGIFEDGKFLENKSVFVISVPRSGSFYVTKLLSQKYNISYAGEIFNNRKLKIPITNEEKFKDSFNLVKNNYLVKIHPHHFQAINDDILDMPKIILYRRDIVTQFISNLYAEAIGRWQFYSETEEVKEADKKSLIISRANFDGFILQLKRLYELSLLNNCLWVAYEDFCSDVDFFSNDIAKKFNFNLFEKDIIPKNITSLYKKSMESPEIPIKRNIDYTEYFSNYEECVSWFDDFKNEEYISSFAEYKYKEWKKNV